MANLLNPAATVVWVGQAAACMKKYMDAMKEWDKLKSEYDNYGLSDVEAADLAGSVWASDDPAIIPVAVGAMQNVSTANKALQDYSAYQQQMGIFADKRPV